jgi:hypothetical protein
MENEKIIEQIISKSIKIGMVAMAAQYGLIDETVTEQQALKMYGKKLITEWRSKRWIVGYPNGNKERNKFYYKRSELETASRMVDIYNIIPPSFLNRKDNQIEQDREKIREIQKKSKITQ